MDGRPLRMALHPHGLSFNSTKLKETQLSQKRNTPQILKVGLCVIFALLDILIVKWFRTLLRTVGLSESTGNVIR